MAGTRRSTRQATAQLPKQNTQSSLSVKEEPPRHHGKKTTRRKRAHGDIRHEEEEEEEEEAEAGIVDDSPRPRKKIATSKPPRKTAGQSKSSSSSSAPTAPSKQHPPTAPPAPSTPTNRTPNGDQEVYWLLKAEPLARFENGVDVSFSIDALAACTAPEPWSGVRNPQARNNMRAMRAGDLGFFYHSNAKPSGVAGIVRVVEEAKVDETAFDPKDPYYDAKSNREDPKWWCVAVELVEKFERVVSLEVLKREAATGGVLRDMQVVHNSRLSVCRVRKQEWDFVLHLARETGKKQAKEH